LDRLGREAGGLIAGRSLPPKVLPLPQFRCIGAATDAAAGTPARRRWSAPVRGRTAMTTRVTLRIARTALATAVLLASTTLRAQPTAPPTAPTALPTSLAPDARLRVHLRSARAPYVVRVVRVAPDTLWVRPWDADAAGVATGEFAIAIADLRRLERSAGRRTRVLRNGGLGAAGGLIAGALIGAYIGATDEEGWFEISPAEGAIFLGVGLAIPAGVVGALTGVFPTERWRDVPLPASPGVSSGSLRGAPRIRPRIGLTRVPVRGARAARALTVGVTVGMTVGGR
jgi:hypothetical protein